MKKPRLKFDILTLFPGMFQGPLTQSLLARAEAKGLVKIQVHNLRDYCQDKHRKADDKPYGGGSGMLLKVEPIYQALKRLSASKKNKEGKKPFVVYLSPRGKTLTQPLAIELAKKSHFILLCGHYEGIDDRALRWVDEEISIGDYVLTGGELPSMVLVDVLSRLVPGVVKEWESVKNDSFFDSLLDCSQYTRPQKFLGMRVPPILLSGNHKEIQLWRQKDSLRSTVKKRPDLVKNLSNGNASELYDR